MATVTGFTAARMQTIEDSTVVDGNIVGDDLILLTRDNTEINAGNVRGPVGPTGPPAAEQPTGMITMFAGPSAPSGYLICNGAAISRATYASLFSVIGTTYGTGDGSTTFNLPNLANKFPVGLGVSTWSDTLGESGGSKDSIVVSHNHTGPSHSHSGPSHSHGMNHAHTASSNTTGSHGHAGVTASAGSHQHTFYQWIGFFSGITVPGGGGLQTQNSAAPDASPTQQLYTTEFAGTHAHTLVIEAAGNHAHSITVNTFTGTTSNAGTGSTGAAGTGNTSTSGVDGTDKNLPPYVTLNFIIKT